ncbi:MAG: aldo/keto reductase [Candidatus Binataceae bacterium]
MDAIGDGQISKVPGVVTQEGSGPPPKLIDDLDKWFPARDLGRRRNKYFIGVLDPCASSMAAWQFHKALYLAREHNWHRFVSMQNHYNLVYREEEREMNPVCIDWGVGLIPWSPLARGFLAGNRKKGSETPTTRAKSDEFARGFYFRDADYAVLDAVEQVARERGITPSQVATAWILQAPGVTAPIIGATKLKHLEEAVSAVDVRLSADEVKAVEKPYVPHPVLGHAQPDPRRMAQQAA